jgi:hypothetical protein
MGLRETKQRFVRRWIVGLGLLGLSCEGGQTGEGPPSYACKKRTRGIALDDETFGVSPQRLVELATGPVTEPLHWWEPDPNFPYGPEHGVGSVTVELIEADSHGTYVDLEPTVGELESGCKDYVEIGVVLGIRSESGALDETIASTLEAYDRYATHFRTRFAGRALNGTFAFEDGPTDEGTLEYELRGAFSEHGASGAFEMHYIEGEGDTSIVEGGTLATWPTAGLCDDHTATVPLDRGEASAQAGIDLSNLATGLVLVTSDGRRIALEMEATDAGFPACVVSGWNPHSLPEGALVTEIVLSVTTEDGAIDQEFEATLAAIAASDGSLAEARIEVQCGTYASSEFAARCGEWGVDASSYDYLILSSDLSFRPSSGSPEVGGAFTIRDSSEESEADDVLSFRLERE